MIKKTRRCQGLLCHADILSLLPGLLFLQPVTYHGLGIGDRREVGKNGEEDRPY